jgi:hypothetical protein
MREINRFGIVFLIGATVFGSRILNAQNSPQNQGNSQDTQRYLVERLNQLETETQTLRAEVQRLKTESAGSPQASVAGVPAQWAANPPVAPAPTPAPGINPAVTAPLIPPTAPPVTMSQVQAEVKKWSWKKGDFTVTPYGYLWANMVYESQVSNSGDYALYIYSPTDRNYNDYNVDAKSTRLGFDITGPRIACLDCAQSGGKVEFDFQGNFTQENKGSVLLRHAYWEVKDDEFRLLAGQTWDVISPLYPGTIMYSVYWDAGNIGYRRPQFRAERYLAFSDTLLFTAQGSVDADIVTDTGAGVVNDHAALPVAEGRIAWTFGPRGKEDHPIVFGVSSHLGNQRFYYTGVHPDDVLAKTWSFNADLKAPVNERLGFLGEYFTGENLGAFLGGIGQGFNIPAKETIYSSGGWMEVYYYWTPCWHSHFGYTVDDPVDHEVPAGGRTYNQAIWGNLIYDVTKQFQIGLEVGQWETVYKDKLPGDSTRIEFMARYGF